MTTENFKAQKTYLRNVEFTIQTRTRELFFDSSAFKVYKFMTHFVYQWPFQKWSQIFMVMCIEIPVSTIIVWGQVGVTIDLNY